MNKEQATELLYSIGIEVAQELGCNLTIEQDGDYGIWTDLLKDELGEYKQIILHDGQGKRKGNNVELTRRFSSPKICIFSRNEKGQEILASMELSDYEPNRKGDYVHTGKWRFSESQVWRPEGVQMFNRIYSMWTERGGE